MPPYSYRRVSKAPKKTYVRKGKGSTVRAPMSRVRRTRSLGLKTHSFSRLGTTLSLQSSPGYTTSSASLKFQFNQLINYGDFTGLFDRYKINMVILKIQLEANPDASYRINGNTAGNSANFYPKLWYAPDYDDNTAASLDDMKQLQNVKMAVCRPNSFITIKCKPAILAQTYATAVTTGYAPKWGQWIDCANVDVPHYGIKMCLDMLGYDAGSNYQIRIEPKFYFQCKDVR